MNKKFAAGVVATNQARKDWGLVAQVCRLLLDRDPKAQFWWHTDMLYRSWSIPALLQDYSLSDNVEVTLSLTDRELAERYRQCRVTLHPGSEGFGYPIFESLACGTPAIHGDYAGGASIMKTCKLESMLVQPQIARIEGQQNSARPVYHAQDWLEALDAAWCVDLHHYVEHLYWSNLFSRWQKWFLDGI